MNGSGRKIKIFESPFHIIGIMATSVFVAEVAVMIVLHRVSALSVWSEALLDSSLLTLILSPIFYFFLLRPVLTLTHMRNRAIENMKKTTVSREYMNSIFHSVRDALVVVDTDGVVQKINTATMKLLGYGEHELVGRSIQIIFPENAEYYDMLKNANVCINTEADFVARDGKRIPVYFSSSTMSSEDGSVLGIVCSAKDMTDRKNMQEMLIEEHEELNRLFKQVEIAKREWESTMDCVRNMIILTDVNGSIRRFNRALEEFAQIPREKVLGSNFMELMKICEMDSVSFYAGSTELLHRPTNRRFEMNSYPFESDQLEFSGVVITIHETTELKNVTEELERAYTELKSTQSQILQREKMASIGQLAAGVAHEINNPMGFISSNLGTLEKYVQKMTEFIDAQTEALQSAVSEEMSEKMHALRKKLKLNYILSDIRELIEESMEGAGRVKRIVQNLKRFSRIDESEYKYSDINECIEETLNIVWNELKYKARIERDYGTLPLTHCNPYELNQVFMNLFVNASHAIEKDGAIRIRTWNGDGSIHVSISDTGCGIPEEIRERIFEPFFTTKEVGKGTGLGLSISYDIVKKHSGEIIVESEEGKGSTFVITIPVTEEK